MSASQLSPVQFHGNTLFLISHNGEPFTPMKPIVEGMGMDWPSQYRKLSTNKERWVVVMLTMTVEGQRKEVVCMPVRKLPAYLGTISPHKVRPELRDRIVTYQNECDDALWKHWTGQQSARALPAPRALPALATPEERKPLDKLVKVWASLLGGDGGVYARIWTQVNAHLGLLSIDQSTPEQIQKGIAFVQGKIDGLQRAAPSPKRKALPPASHPAQAKADALLAKVRFYIGEIDAAATQVQELLVREHLQAHPDAVHDLRDTRSRMNAHVSCTTRFLWSSVNSTLSAVEDSIKLRLELCM